MGVFIKGDIVIVPFPFSDLSTAKRRPALVLTDSEQDGYGDFILAQITSQQKTDACAIEINADDFECGALRHTSNVRPNKLFTANESAVIYKAGNLQAKKMKEILSQTASQFNAE